MNTLISSAIAGSKSFVKALRLKQLVITFLAGFFLLASTACGSSANATSARSYDAAPSTYNANEKPSRSDSPYDKGTGPQRELYKPTQAPKGGMNNYSDDPAYNRGDTKVQARKLIDRAENRLETKRAESPKDVLENAREENPLVEGAKDVSRRLGDAREQAKENLTEGAQQGTRNLKTNLEKARNEAPNVVDTAKQNADNATRGVREGAEDLAGGAQKASNRAANEIRNRA